LLLAAQQCSVNARLHLKTCHARYCALQAVGFLLANLWFYGGVLFFGIIVYFIPEPSAADAVIKSTEAPMPDKVTSLPRYLQRVSKQQFAVEYDKEGATVVCERSSAAPVTLSRMHSLIAGQQADCEGRA
jgi:hypothetical protein